MTKKLLIKNTKNLKGYVSFGQKDISTLGLDFENISNAELTLFIRTKLGLSMHKRSSKRITKKKIIMLEHKLREIENGKYAKKIES